MMGIWKNTKSEHTGDKASSRKSGFWGTRWEAKSFSRKVRRHNDRKAIKEQLES